MLCSRFELYPKKNCEPNVITKRARSGQANLAGYESGYGYGLLPYGTAYRRALRTTRTRFRNRLVLAWLTYKGISLIKKRSSP